MVAKAGMDKGQEGEKQKTAYPPFFFKSSADEWIRKLWYIYTMEYYSAIKKNSFESVLMRWMKLEPIIQGEVSQKDKDQYTNTYIWNLKRWLTITQSDFLNDFHVTLVNEMGSLCGKKPSVIEVLTQRLYFLLCFKNLIFNGTKSLSLN